MIKISDEFVVRIIPESVDSGGKKGGIASGLGGGLGKLGALLGVAGIVLSILRPIMPMIKGLGKMIGEFLRPIADIIMMLLAPILAMLRPILITFKSLMAPFKQAAMTGIAAANKLIAQGMQIGGEVGGELVGEGIAGALSAASLMFGGLIKIMFTPLAEAMGKGEEFKAAMEGWQESVQLGVLRAVILSETVTELATDFESLEKGATAALQGIDGQVALLQNVVDDWNIGNFKENLDTAKSIVETTGLLIKEDFGGLEEKAKELNTPFGELMGYLAVGVKPASDLSENIKALGKEMTEADRIIASMTFMGGAVESVIQEQKKSEWKKILAAIAMFGVGGATMGFAAGGPGGAVIGGVAGAALGAYIGTTPTEREIKEVYEAVTEAENQSIEMFGITAAMVIDTKKSLDEMTKNTKSTMNIKAGIPFIYDKGLNAVNTSTGTFTLNLSGFSTKINTTAVEINNAIDRIKSYEASAASSASRAKANADESAVGALE